MPKLNNKKVELFWPNKYDKDGGLIEIERPGPYPFQIVESVNVPRIEKKNKNLSLFDFWDGDEGETFEDGWKNKLIWGDNKIVMSSLLKNFSGKIDLIYIDPPFATGADFKFRVNIGDEKDKIKKEHSILEEKAYRDTWGGGLSTYIKYMYARLLLMKDLLSDRGSIYIHLDWHVVHYIKLIMDEVFGNNNFQAEIVWQRTLGHHLSSKLDVMTDTILWYTKTKNFVYNQQYQSLNQVEMDKKFQYIEKETNRRFTHEKLEQTSNIYSKGETRLIQGKEVTSNIGWRWTQETFEKRLKENPYLIYWTKEGKPRYKRYADQYKGRKIGNLWNDISPLSSNSKERLEFDTQKPEDLLKRIILESTNSDNLVGDFFCGSGTTLAVAEKLGRRWVGCDLSRYSIHLTRKRLLEIAESKSLKKRNKKYNKRPEAFEILNLGKYERQYWQVTTFNNKDEKQLLYEYLAFMLKLYDAEPISGFNYIHGKKNKALIYIGAVDSPVTIQEVINAIKECKLMDQNELHILGWEWEMGLNSGIQNIAKRENIKLKLRIIPNDVLDNQAVEKGDIKFFELAYFKINLKISNNEVLIKLTDFVIPHTDLIPEDIKNNIKNWSNWIDYWAVDFNFQNDTFNNKWTSFRTRENRSLISTVKHKYKEVGNYTLFIKVIDVFGVDTSQVYEVTIK
ncbi:hypothetical protein LCGC14_0708780 [marine sediment metagenome]|uniref:DNA methylase N-4/N-6 domain-containing protein n=1 Tax=marine sediment metagenome TaxID=412755 RepID=A0A0F9T1K0_9ZZZZ